MRYQSGAPNLSTMQAREVTGRFDRATTALAGMQPRVATEQGRAVNRRNKVILAIVLALAALAMYVSLFIKIGSG